MTFKDLIDAMKFREQKLRDDAGDLLIKADAIHLERMKLELFIDREQAKEDKCNPENLQSLIDQGS